MPDTHHSALVGDVADALDVEAGLRDATVPTLGHASLTADLGQNLDIRAGLAAALPDAAPSAMSTDVDKGSATVHRALAWLAAQAGARRLAIRTQPWLDVLDAYLAAVSCCAVLDHAHLLVLALDHAADSDREHDMRTCAGALGPVLSDARRRASMLDSELYGDIAGAVEDAQALEFEIALRNDTRARARRLARALTYAIDNARRIASDVLHTDGRIGHDFTVGLERDLAVDSRAGRANALDRQRLRLMELRNQFAGADLRRVDLDGLSLDGVRWNEATRWPPRWEATIRAESVRLPEGGWEISRGGLHVQR